MKQTHWHKKKFHGCFDVPQKKKDDIDDLYTSIKKNIFDSKNFKIENFFSKEANTSFFQACSCLDKNSILR